MMWTTLGFDEQKKYFDQAIADGSLAHAYLFTGQAMIGKRTFALELARHIADTSDILEIAQHDIEAIRGVKQFLSLTAFNSDHKVVIVDNAGAMSEEAQNTLLKILEEPSASSILILIASREDDVLTTISSRCRLLSFSPHPRKVFDEYFVGKKLSQSQQDFLYAFSNGSIGLIHGLEDYSGIKVSIAEYVAIADADINKRFTIAQSLAKDEQLQRRILDWMLYLRTKKMYAPLRGLLELNHAVANASYNKQLALENFMLQL